MNKHFQYIHHPTVLFLFCLKQSVHPSQIYAELHFPLLTAVSLIRTNSHVIDSCAEAELRHQSRLQYHHL